MKKSVPRSPSFSEQELEKYSSAFTLSDMEIFLFPELMYSLVLANIMSPEIWKWREDPWFRGIGKMNSARRINRVKQYIMDHYSFNLDLETWGLTDKDRELARFSSFVDEKILASSNALFGYEGDRYYFDMDIRRHFGLDKYDSDIIPYWKTETVEAMNAFRFKPGYEQGAGECVSLASLYAAALFIVGEIPLEDIYLLGTPLHSQNFILSGDGVITNNRRIVTRQMWFNGTELSALARRALENEQVTLVAHCSGWVHSVFPGATMDPNFYDRLKRSLHKFLETEVDYEIFINFLRNHNNYRSYFQIAFPCHGNEKFIRMEKAFGYEHGSKNRLGDKTARKLFCEMDEEDLTLNPDPERIIIRAEDQLFRRRGYEVFLNDLLAMYPIFTRNDSFSKDFRRFVHTTPRLPSVDTWYDGAAGKGIRLAVGMSRTEIMEYLSGLRHDNGVADLAFYAGRYLDHCDWNPFLKACLERNPVSVLFFSQAEIREVYNILLQWPGESIYSGNRLALPDEIVNFKRGDGIEKAITIMNLLKSRHQGENAFLTVTGNVVKIKGQAFSFEFITRKSFDGLAL